jgi:glycosyltransferase involved in cell wall biosynthesis
MRVCLVYDCLFPHTVGGAERWYRNLAERLADEGHDVTYMTMRQWERGTEARVPGVNVVPVAPRMSLYTAGRRRILPPVVFGAGVLLHLLRRRNRYDVVHTASFPYFSLFAAAVARRVRGFRLFADWHEVWSEEYWQSYLGPIRGRLAYWIQSLCARTSHGAFAFSRLHARRLRDEGHAGEVTILEGEYAGSLDAPEPASAEPLLVFAGRHIPEKRVTAIVPALALARETVPSLRAEIFGDGPDRQVLLRQVASAGLDQAVDAPGFVPADRIPAALRRALCLVLPSSREGYGLIVVEAAALGTPSVVVRGPDNAATELIEDGVNGFVAESPDPEDLADSILRVHEAGLGLRHSTAEWFARNSARLSIESSLATVLWAYER